MKLITSILLAAASACGQSNQIQLCDQQSPRHCMTIKAPATLPANVVCATSTTGLGACSGDVTQGFTMSGESSVSPGTASVAEMYRVAATGVLTLRNNDGSGGYSNIEVYGATQVTNSAFPVITAIRTGSDTNTARAIGDMALFTSGTPANGLGPTIRFDISTAGLGPITGNFGFLGDIGAVRNGGDNTGDLILRTAVAGAIGERVRITSTGVGIGTTTPDAELEVVTVGTSDPRGLVTTEYNNGDFAATVLMRKARGTEASPTTITNGQTISSVLSSAWDGSAWQYPSYIVSRAVVSGGNIGADVRIATRAPGGSLTERAIFTNDGYMLSGLASTDVSVLAGAIVSANAFVSATATSNASVGSFAAVPGSYVALASSKTGSGTYLPLSIFTSATERVRVGTGGNTEFLGDVLANGTRNVGAAASGYFQHAYFSGNVEGARIRIIAGTPASITDFMDFYQSGAGDFRLADSSANVVYNYQNQTTPFHVFRGDVIPSASNTYYSGTASYKWKGIFAIDYTGTGVFTLSGSSSISMDWLPASSYGYALGGASNIWNKVWTKDLFVDSANGARTTGSFIPTTTNTDELGSSSLYWNKAYVKDDFISDKILIGLASSDVSASAGSLIAADTIVSATATSNASIGSFAAVASTYVAFASSKTGSGTYLPMAFFTSATERARILTTGQFLFGLASTDVSASAGALISADALISATATANASIGSFAAVASTYVAFASSKTGSGTYLPMAFFTSATERARFLTSGELLVNRTTSTGSGAKFQVNGTIEGQSGFIAPSGTAGATATLSCANVNLTISGGIVTAASCF